MCVVLLMHAWAACERTRCARKHSERVCRDTRAQHYSNFALLSDHSVPGPAHHSFGRHLIEVTPWLGHAYVQS